MRRTLNGSTVAGVGTPGFDGDGLKAQLNRLLRPSTVALDRCGNLPIADSGNDRLRRLNLVASCPPLAVTDPSGTGIEPAWVLVPLVVGAVAALALARRRRPKRSAIGAGRNDASAAGRGVEQHH